MTLPRVSICGWCGRALGLESDRRLPPGEHVGKIRVTSAPCEKCKGRFEPDGVTHSDTTRLYKKDEKKASPQ